VRTTLSLSGMNFIIYSTAVTSGLLAGAISPSLAYSRSILLGITLMHSVLSGALFGVFVSAVMGIPLAPSLTAVLFAITFSILTAEAVNRGIPEDAAISLVVSISVAISIIFTFLVALHVPLGVSAAMSYVFGISSILTINDLLRVIISLMLVMPLAHLFWYEYKFISFDPEGAEAMGLSIRFYRYLYYGLASVAATAIAMTLGVLLTHIIISLPGLFALRKKYLYPYRLSYLVGVTIVVGGYLISLPLSLPPSAGVGILATISLVYLFTGGSR